MKYLELFENYDIKYKMVDIEYKAIVNDIKGNPMLYVTELSLVKDDGNEVECKIKGYRRMIKTIGENRIKAWFYVDDFEKDRTTTLQKNNFRDGEVRKKVFADKIL